MSGIGNSLQATDNKRLVTVATDTGPWADINRYYICLQLVNVFEKRQNLVSFLFSLLPSLSYDPQQPWLITAVLATLAIPRKIHLCAPASRQYIRWLMDQRPLMKVVCRYKLSITHLPMPTTTLEWTAKPGVTLCPYDLHSASANTASSLFIRLRRFP